MMKFKEGDVIAQIGQPYKRSGVVEDVHDNPYDDELDYSIKWDFLSFGIGYSPDQIDAKYTHHIDLKQKWYHPLIGS